MYRPQIFAFFVCSVVSVFANETSLVSETNVYSSAVPEYLPNVSGRKWISQIFHEAEALFDMNTDVRDECRRDFMTYKLHADNQTVWAVRMLESSEWPRLGVFSGVTSFFGSWSECLRSRGPNIRGQYCLAEATYNFPSNTIEPTTPHWIDWPEEDASAWDAIKSYELVIQRVPRQKLTWAMCIPSSCHADDLQNSLTNTLRPVFEAYYFNVSVRVDPHNCRVDKTTRYPAEFSVTASFFILLVLLMITASISDFYSPNKRTYQGDGLQNDGNGVAYSIDEETKISVLEKLYQCFSVLQVWKLLIKYSPNVYTGVYALKSLCLLWIISAHVGMLRMASPLIDAEENEMSYRPWNIFLGSHNIVDVFFLISGFLNFHQGLTPTKRAGVLYVILSLIFRWCRLILPTSLVMLLLTNILPYLSDGPRWYSNFINEMEHCSENWWANILAVNNLIHEDKMCLISTWYVAADMQLTILGNILMWILTKNWLAGIILMILSGMGATAAVFLKIYLNNYSGIPMPVLLPLDQLRSWPAYRNLYVKTYSRIGPYLVGCALSLLITTMKEKKYKFTRVQTFMWLIFCIVVGFGLQIYAFMFLMIGRPNDPVESGLFGAVQRIFFVIPFASIIFVYFLSVFDLLNAILDMKIFLFTGRLAYSGFLISLPYQMFMNASIRRPITGTSFFEVFHQSIGDIGCTVLYGFIFFLVCEGPIINMLHLLQKVTSGDQNNKSTIGTTSSQSNGAHKAKKLTEDMRMSNAVHRWDSRL